MTGDMHSCDGQDRLLSARGSVLIFLAFLTIAVGLHIGGFHAAMIFDGRGWIQEKAYLFARGSVVDVLGIVPARPLFMATLYANYSIAGMEPAAFRLVNAVFLAGTGLALLVLILAVFDAPAVRVRASRTQKRVIAFALALVFVAHPLQTFVVLYIWQREALMACFFFYWGLAAYVVMRSGGFRSPAAGYALTGALFLGCMLSKENAVTFPVVAAAAELTLFWHNLREMVKRCLLIGLMVLPAAVVSAAATLALHAAQSEHPAGVIARLAAYYREGGITAGQAAMTACRELFSYLWIMVAPFAQTLAFIRAETVSTSLWVPPETISACVGVAGLFALAVALARRQPTVSFGILFFLVTPLPESLLIPHYLYFGYRAILPMAGVLIVVGWAAAEAVSGRATALSRVSRPLLAVVALVVVVGFAVQTFNQSRRWGPMDFWQTAYSTLPRFSASVQRAPYLDIVINYSGQLIAAGRHHEAVEVLSRPYVDAVEHHARPEDRASPDIDAVAARLASIAAADRHTAAVALLQLGLALDKTGQSAEAIELYRRAAEIAPRIAAVRVNLGVALEKNDDLTGAIAEYRSAAEAEPHLPDAYLRLGDVLQKTGDMTAAIAALKKAIEIHPGMGAAYESLGLALKRSGDLRAAAESMRKAVQLEPSRGAAANNLARVMEESGDLAGAIEHYARAVRLLPDSAEVRRNFGNALLRAGRADEAARHYRKALELKPGFAEAQANLGTALLTLGRPAEAVEALRQALAGMEDNAELHNALGVALAQLGKTVEAAEQFRKALTVEPNHAGARQNLRRLTE